jgi:hypothetical protein
MNVRLAWLILALIVAGGMILRQPALTWLSDAAASSDFSFHPDDQRFVLAAEDIKAPNPDGYPQGMTTQLYLAFKLVSRFANVGILKVMHAITIFYAALSVVLTYAIARSWSMSRGAALFAAALFSVAPLAVVQSNFGTADITALCYFYATLLAGGEYLRGRKQLWFVILCALTGMAVAIKFFIPLFAPLALVLAVQPRGARLTQLLTAIFGVIASFEALSFFKFTPWDLHHLFTMLRDDNVVIAAARSDIIASGPIDQLGRYSWDLVSAVGIPAALLLVAGLAQWLRSLYRGTQPARAWPSLRNWRSLVTPNSLFVAALSLQAALLLISRIHAERHPLVFVPVICILAARTLFTAFEGGRRVAVTRALAVAAILLYQTSDAIAVEKLYPEDVRNDMASWTARQASEGRQVVSMAPFSNVRGSVLLPDLDPLLLERSAYIVTCDFEFARYLHHRTASEVFHPMGGQERLDFFRGVFEGGTSEFGIVREFKSTPRGIELRLIAADFMAPLGTFVPRRCYALGREGALPADAQRAIRSELAPADRGY